MADEWHTVRCTLPILMRSEIERTMINVCQQFDENIYQQRQVCAKFSGISLTREFVSIGVSLMGNCEAKQQQQKG
jgi:hypothetical protein